MPVDAAVHSYRTVNTDP